MGACDTNKRDAAYRPSTTHPLYPALKSASHIDNAVSLNSLGVYVNTIELIYRAVQNGWEESSESHIRPRLRREHVYCLHCTSDDRLLNSD